MGITYANLDETTRSFMREESDLGGHYPSPRLNEVGLKAWVDLLNQAIETGDDDWLAEQLRDLSYFKHEEDYSRNGKIFSRRINAMHAAQQLAEGEFNRYYLRGLCRRAQNDNVPALLVYRGKEVSVPRPESQAKVGTLIGVNELLQVLRRNDFVSIEDALGVPGGPNSGLTARLP
jgi:hypothetical protein